jgi:hypothetical protein
MARTMSVKIPVSALIADIEKSIAKIDEAVANYADERKQYELATEAYKKQVASAVSEYLKNNSAKIGYEFDSTIRITTNYSGRLELVLDPELIGLGEKPTEPSKPNQREWFGREHATRKEILERNLKVLRMTTQEEVSASSYSSVMELI